MVVIALQSKRKSALSQPFCDSLEPCNFYTYSLEATFRPQPRLSKINEADIKWESVTDAI